MGYPGMRLRPFLTGTADGLAMAPYIRESRRIRAAFTVKEQHVGADARRAVGLTRPELFADSAGIGYYRIDLHPSTGGDNYIDIDAFPFQIDPSGTASCTACTSCAQTVRCDSSSCSRWSRAYSRLPATAR